MGITSSLSTVGAAAERLGEDVVCFAPWVCKIRDIDSAEDQGTKPGLRSAVDAGITNSCIVRWPYAWVLKEGCGYIVGGPQLYVNPRHGDVEEMGFAGTYPFRFEGAG